MHFLSHKKIQINGAIEAFGLCGAGKSVILNELIPIFKNEGGATPLLIEKPVEPGVADTLLEALRIISKAFRHSPLALVKFLTSYKSWWLPLKLGYRSAGMNVRHVVNGALLLDSGILQPFVSFEVEVNNVQKKVPIDAFFLAISLPAIVIYVRVSAETALQRYINREITAGRKIKSDCLWRRFENGFKTCEWLYNAYLALELPILILDAEERITNIQLEHFAMQILNNFISGNKK